MKHSLHFPRLRHLARTSAPCPGIARGACALLSAALLAAPAHALDVNQASASELQTLAGLGPKTAALIVKERTRAGPYESLDNLAERVKGIGAKKARRLESAGLRAGRATAAPSALKPAVSPVTPGPRRPIQSPAGRSSGL